MHSLLSTIQALAVLANIYPALVHGNAAFPQAHARPHAGIARFPRRQATTTSPDPLPAAPAEEKPIYATSIATTYTLFTPSPGAEATPITRQFQPETSYVPQITICSMVLLTARQLAPGGMLSLPSANTSAPLAMPPSYGQPMPTIDTGSRISLSLYTAPRPTYTNSTLAPYANTTTTGLKPYYANTTSSLPGTPHITEGCATHYSPTLTPICATTLSGPATAYTITKCNQQLTFSSQYGYRLSLPPGVDDPATVVPQSALPAVQTITTYYIAPWTELTREAGAVPPTVTSKICSTSTPYNSYTLPAGAIGSPVERCIDETEAWQTTLIPTVSTTTSHIDISTTIQGPGKLMVETFEADVTERVTTFSLSSRLVVLVSTEGVSTVMRALGAPRTVDGPRTTSVGVARQQGRVPTSTVTMTVWPLSAEASAASKARDAGEASDVSEASSTSSVVPQPPSPPPALQKIDMKAPAPPAPAPSASAVSTSVEASTSTSTSTTTAITTTGVVTRTTRITTTVTGAAVTPA